MLSTTFGQCSFLFYSHHFLFDSVLYFSFKYCHLPLSVPINIFFSSFSHREYFMYTQCWIEFLFITHSHNFHAQPVDLVVMTVKLLKVIVFPSNSNHKSPQLSFNLMIISIFVVCLLPTIFINHHADRNETVRIIEAFKIRLSYEKVLFIPSNSFHFFFILLSTHSNHRVV